MITYTESLLLYLTLKSQACQCCSKTVEFVNHKIVHGQMDRYLESSGDKKVYKSKLLS